MSENPKCPYCGATMALHLNMGFYSYYCPSCYAEAPASNSIASAYAAAMKRDRAKGEWIKLDMHCGEAQYKCSACGMECYVPECMYEPLYAFCPNCGADMRQEANEEGV